MSVTVARSFLNASPTTRASGYFALKEGAKNFATALLESESLAAYDAYPALYP